MFICQHLPYRAKKCILSMKMYTINENVQSGHTYVLSINRWSDSNSYQVNEFLQPTITKIITESRLKDNVKTFGQAKLIIRYLFSPACFLASATKFHCMVIYTEWIFKYSHKIFIIVLLRLFEL